MIWFYAEDDFHYQEKSLNKIKNKYNLKQIIPLPDKDSIKAHIKEKNVAFIAPFYPEKIFPLSQNSSFFSIIRLENFYEPYTKEQIEKKLSKTEVLSKKLGIKILASKNTFADYAGAETLISLAKKTELKMLTGIETKGFLIVGLPGTGKSFFAKCFAGESNRLLVELNFSKIMEDDKPLEKLTSVLNFFKNNPDKYLIWIDEIEKMFENENSQQILGVFLTELNEFSNSKSNVIFIATANNISGMAQKNPEFFRTGGRFDKIIALLPPNEQNAFKIYKLYFNKLYKHFKFSSIPFLFFIKAFNLENYFINTNIDTIANKFIKLLEQKELYSILKQHFIPFYDLLQNIYSNKTGISLTEFEEFKKYNYSEKIKIIRSLIEKKFQSIIPQISAYFDETYNSFLKEHYPLNKENVINSIIQIIFSKYRNMSAIQSRFPYTPAEINFYCNEIFSDYYFNDNFYGKPIDVAINVVSDAVLPLQIQQKEAISKMYSENRNFIEI